jgi:hypothetical protein
MGATMQLASVLGSTLAVVGVGAFTLSVQALGQQRDLSAVWWLLVAALLVKSSRDLLVGEAR